MELPSYFLKRPPIDPQHVPAFERLYTTAIAHGHDREIAYDLDAPKWEFLCYLCDAHDVVLHGSANPDIRMFEPRQSNDVEEFGNRRAVYAASDGIWPMYFAIVNRQRVKALVNACFQIRHDDGSLSEPYYYFSVDADALPTYPWQDGTVYILPKQSFERQLPITSKGQISETAQWASLIEVEPLAKLRVSPTDFPFLDQMNGHDLQLLIEQSTRDPKGFPWRDE